MADSAGKARPGERARTVCAARFEGSCGGRNPPTATHTWCRECQRRNRRRIGHERYADYSPERRKRQIARAMASEAQKRGKIVPTPCPCGCQTLLGLLERHHEDYDKPLEVIFCCPAHHQVLDRARRDRLKAAEATAGELQHA